VETPCKPHKIPFKLVESFRSWNVWMDRHRFPIMLSFYLLCGNDAQKLKGSYKLSVSRRTASGNLFWHPASDANFIPNLRHTKLGMKCTANEDMRNFRGFLLPFILHWEARKTRLDFGFQNCITFWNPWLYRHSWKTNKSTACGRVNNFFQVPVYSQ
jgi:hypothetical protein